MAEDLFARQSNSVSKLRLNPKTISFIVIIVIRNRELTQIYANKMESKPFKMTFGLTFTFIIHLKYLEVLFDINLTLFCPKREKR